MWERDTEPVREPEPEPVPEPNGHDTAARGQGRGMTPPLLVRLVDPPSRVFVRFLATVFVVDGARCGQALLY